MDESVYEWNFTIIVKVAIVHVVNPNTFTLLEITEYAKLI